MARSETPLTNTDILNRALSSDGTALRTSGSGSDPTTAPLTMADVLNAVFDADNNILRVKGE